MTEITDFRGDVVVRNRANRETIRLVGGEGDIRVKNAEGELRFHFDGVHAALYLGGQGNEGDLIVRDGANKQRIKLDGGGGDIWVKDGADNLLFHFDATTAALYLGGQGNEGDLIVCDGANEQRIKLDGGEGHIWMKDAAGNERVRLDGEGGIQVKDAAGNLLFQFYSSTGALYLGHRPPERAHGLDFYKERIKLDGAEGAISVKDAGGNQTFRIAGTALSVGGKDAGGGSIVARDNENNTRIHLNGHDGLIWVKSANDSNAVQIDGTATVNIGCTGNDGDLIVRDAANQQRIKLDGSDGDIILSNADAAEDFEYTDATEVTAGMVMVLGPDGKLAPCSSAYDQTVVGVVSGAGRYRPGIIFDRGEKTNDNRVPISIMGKAACRADAGYGSIRAGDLLTTSPSLGCAMKAADPARAFGAIIGKALNPLDEGEGLVPMLISLQ